MVMYMLNLDKTKKYLLACSYGPDSMALFDMLLKEEYKFSVAHVNYHKRDISNFEEESMRDICLKNNIKCFVLDTSKLPNHKGNFQNWARVVRYKFFAEVLKKENLDAVLVAHHLDDLIETYEMQKSRNLVVDYLGLKEQTIINDVPVIRPLLEYTKKELNDYCIYNNVPFSIDVSNLSPVYSRNKIRLNYINNLTKTEKLLIKKSINEENELNKKLVEEINTKIQNNSLDINDLKNMEKKSQVIALDLLLKNNKINKHISAKFVEEIIHTLNTKQPNISIKLGTNKCIIREYNKLKIVNNLANTQYVFTMDKPGQLNTEYFWIDLKDDYAQFRLTLDDFPITIRPALSGDLSYINGIKKKVKRLYIDWKMPMYLRKIWPLIFNKNGELVYVIRYYDENSLNSNKDFIVKS